MKPNAGKQRVILINGDSTKWYEQAIFIVKKDVNGQEMPIDFVAEAEKIIAEYTKRKNIKNPYAVYENQKSDFKINKAAKGTIDFILNCAMILSCVLLAAVLYSFFR